ncbi:MAG: hypothetical protein ACTJFQ_15420 [Vreelandella alkaliphila]|uniref:hypothetical protein n=1 Tax=Vreelandella alkaliphila TaxID=272774 RepID=UPI003F9719A0
MLLPLLKRMTKMGEVWISADLPDSLQALCTTWAEQRGLTVSVVTGLDAAMEVSHE